MEKAIREGALRLLTSETSCDVIISCQGCRLMAHRIILSIASPMLQDLLRQETTEPAVLIFPDINGSIMSLILDYIYTGSVAIYSNTVQEFLSAANLLKLYLDLDYLEAYFAGKSKECDLDVRNYSKCKKDDEQIECHNLSCSKRDDYKVYPEDYGRMTSPSSKSGKRIPNLMPISSLQTKMLRTKKGLYNRVIPSPWCPRVAPLLNDPRIDCLGNTDYAATRIKTPEKVEENDSNNNNFQILPTIPLPTAYFQETLLKNEFPNQSLLQKMPFPDRIHSPNNLVATPAMISPKKIETESVDEIPKTAYKIREETVDNRTETKTPTKSEEVTRQQDQKVEKQKPFKCNDCGKCFSQLRNYKYHRSVHEGTKEFAARCPECGKVFNDRGYLSSHLKIHRDRKEYACPHCPKRFNQRVAYNMHLRIHTGIKPHECPTCGKSFSRKMLLKQHQRVHTGERPYSCPECGKSFADRSNMSLHARLHTGVKPYACNLCPKSFTKKHHLKTHMNFHTGLKPYSCQNCGLAFSQSSNMRTHYKKCILKSNISDDTSQNTS